MARSRDEVLVLNSSEAEGQGGVVDRASLAQATSQAEWVTISVVPLGVELPEEHVAERAVYQRPSIGMPWGPSRL